MNAGQKGEWEAGQHHQYAHERDQSGTLKVIEQLHISKRGTDRNRDRDGDGDGDRDRDRDRNRDRYRDRDRDGDRDRDNQYLNIHK